MVEKAETGHFVNFRDRISLEKRFFNIFLNPVMRLVNLWKFVDDVKKWRDSIGRYVQNPTNNGVLVKSHFCQKETMVMKISFLGHFD